MARKGFVNGRLYEETGSRKGFVDGHIFESTVSSGATYTLTADSGSYTLTGNSSDLHFNRKLTADSGTYALTGIDSGLLFNRSGNSRQWLLCAQLVMMLIFYITADLLQIQAVMLLQGMTQPLLTTLVLRTPYSRVRFIHPHGPGSNAEI